MDEELLGLISRADRALGRLDGSIQTLPAPDLFVMMYVRKEAVLSSQIEGTQSSLNDVLEAEAKLYRPEHPRDVAEVINYVHAMNHGLGRLEQLPVSVRLIREIHERLLEGVRGAGHQPGQLRQSQNWIGPAGCTLSDATYVPPPPAEMQAALGELEAFLHGNDHLPALVKVGLAHAQFETIHPFPDGNGRVGRLLIVFLLCEKDILRRPVLYISHYFRRHRQRYYDALQAVRDDGDWEGWLKFFLTAVTEVSLEATETARRVVGIREEDRARITRDLGRTAANGLQVHESLFRKPITTVREVEGLTGVTFSAANTLVAKLVSAGVLEEISGRSRNRVYRYSAYVGAFTDV
ncbi:Fic family protein [bacterium]|nr:Fic family protein [bacterium]